MLQQWFQVGGLEVTGQLFGEATVLSSSFTESNFDGLFGLGYESISAIGTNPPFVNMISQGAVGTSAFAFYLSKLVEDVLSMNYNNGVLPPCVHSFDVFQEDNFISHAHLTKITAFYKF